MTEKYSHLCSSKSHYVQWILGYLDCGTLLSFHNQPIGIKALADWPWSTKVYKSLQLKVTELPQLPQLPQLLLCSCWKQRKAMESSKSIRHLRSLKNHPPEGSEESTRMSFCLHQPTHIVIQFAVSKSNALLASFGLQKYYGMEKCWILKRSTKTEGQKWQFAHVWPLVPTSDRNASGCWHIKQ